MPLRALVFCLAVSQATCGQAAVASVYGGSDGLCGHRVAGGGRLDCNALTAAHRSLPFGTHVRVTHAGRSAVVHINDRGPFVRGREIDLSPAAARAVACPGVCNVQLEILR